MFDGQYDNNIEDICSDLINLDKDEPTGSSEVEEVDRKSTRLNSSHVSQSRMPSSA